MNLDAQRKFKLRRMLFIALLGMIVIAIVLAVMRRGEWIIPDEAKQRPNPLQASPKVLESARPLYTENCERCHGVTGKGNGPESARQYPSPSDLTDTQRMNALTDGAIFYQISEGHRPMPSFKRRMTEDQRWQLVLLLRSFAPTPATANQK
jgi:mono/diheme cytochrome c family protein